jgi:hypothetical protein
MLKNIKAKLEVAHYEIWNACYHLARRVGLES